MLKYKSILVVLFVYGALVGCNSIKMLQTSVQKTTNSKFSSLFSISTYAKKLNLNIN